MQIQKKQKYFTGYQRAKAKALRLGWPPAATSGLVKVKALIHKSGRLNQEKKEGYATPGFASNPHNTSFKPAYAFKQLSTRKNPNHHKNGNINGKDDNSNSDDHRYNPYTYTFSISFQFFSAVSKSQFVVQAFYHAPVDTFMVKFFNRSHKSLNKYAARTGKGDFMAILRTNFDILVHLSTKYPAASFGFIGERSFFKDKATGSTLLEPMADNQRFRIYRLFLNRPDRQRPLNARFESRYIAPLSTYLLLSKHGSTRPELRQKETEILKFMSSAYPELNFTDL